MNELKNKNISNFFSIKLEIKHRIIKILLYYFIVKHYYITLSIIIKLTLYYFYADKS